MPLSGLALTILGLRWLNAINAQARDADFGGVDDVDGVLQLAGVGNRHVSNGDVIAILDAEDGLKVFGLCRIEPTAFDKYVGDGHVIDVVDT